MAPINLSEGWNYAGPAWAATTASTAAVTGRVRGADPVQYPTACNSCSVTTTTRASSPTRSNASRSCARPGVGALRPGQHGRHHQHGEQAALDGAGNEIGLQVGNYNRLQVEGDLNGRLNPEGSLLYRVVFVGRDSDTQVDYVPDNVAASRRR